MFDVSWLVRNKVLLIETGGVVTDAEIRSGMSLLHVMLVGIEDTVHCVIDTHNLQKTPMNLPAFIKVNANREYSGWTINVVDNPLKHKLTEVTTRLTTGRDVKMVATIDDAVAFLHRQDASLSQYGFARV